MNIRNVGEDRQGQVFAGEPGTDKVRELGAVVAKMTCNSLETKQYGPEAVHATIKVSLGAIYGKEGENKDFADATPSGECWMQINVGRPAAKFFKPGKQYYVTFTEAPA